MRCGENRTGWDWKYQGKAIEGAGTRYGELRKEKTR
jgi:hypothetical protein